MNKSKEKSYMNAMEEKCFENYLSQAVIYHIEAQPEEAMEEYLENCLGKAYNTENIINVIFSDEKFKRQADRLIRYRIIKDIERERIEIIENFKNYIVSDEIYNIFMDKEELERKVIRKKYESYLEYLLPELMMKYLIEHCKYEHFSKSTQEWIKEICIGEHLNDTILMHKYGLDK